MSITAGGEVWEVLRLTDCVKVFGEVLELGRKCSARSSSSLAPYERETALKLVTDKAVNIQ